MRTQPWVVCGLNDGRVRVIDTTTGAVITEICNHQTTIYDLDLPADESTIFIASGDNEVANSHHLPTLPHTTTSLYLIGIRLQLREKNINTVRQS